MDKVDKTETKKAKRYSLVPIYSDESVSIPDSSVAERDVLSCVSNEELGKSLPDQASTEMSKATEVTSTEISDGRSSKTFPLVADDHPAVSIPDASMAGDDQQSELDVGCVLNDELGNTLPDKASTPREKDKERGVGKIKKHKEEEKKAERKCREEEKRKREEENEAGSMNSVDPSPSKMSTGYQRHSFSEGQKYLKHHFEDKPQFYFKDKINNDSKLFLHKLKKKPHCLNPLSMEQRDRHPYKFELNKFTPHPKFLTVQREVPRFKPVYSTPLIMVDTIEALEQLLQDLLSQTVIGVDLEHHSERSYRGITCLMQISTDKTDYIVDTLQLWDHLQPLNNVFCDPNIVKIFQGADSDVIWLQRDFGIYVVNLFDTFQAATLLGFEKKGLSFLLQHYCQVHVNKKYQLADWRIRPLPQEMVKYAREDTHYLIYIYERMKRDLYSRRCLGDVKLTPEMKKGTPEESKDRNPNSESSQITPVDEKGVNQVLEVWNNSRSVCLRQFKIPTLEEMYSKFHSSLNKEEKMLNKQQSYALREIFSWRDEVARELDESPNFVMAKFVMLNIISQLHNQPENILQPISLHRSVHQHLPQLHEVIVRAKTIAIQSSPIPKKQTKKSGAASSSAHESSPPKNNFDGESPMADDVSRRENKASKLRVSDSTIPALIRILHGNIRSKHAIAEEFLLHLEQNRAGENKNGPSKAQILAKIAEISSWGKCTEAGAMNGRNCWLVQSDVLERYNLHELSAINTWEFATETKKRGRKADDSRTEEDTPPAKTPRVSLIKQFVQPAASSSASKVSSSQENELPEGKN